MEGGGQRGSGASTCVGSPMSSSAARGSGRSVTGMRGRRPREGPGAGQNGQGAGRSQGGRQEGGEGGEPCPSVPSVPAAHPAGKPGQLLWPARPRIASLPGRAAPARSASARNRARFGGPQAAGEGPPRLQGARGSGDLDARQSPGCGDLERGPGTGQGAGRDPGLGAGRGQGLDVGAQAGARGSGAWRRQTAGPGAGIPGARPARGVGRGADLTACEEASPGAGRADGRTEEFAAGGAVGRVHVCSLTLYTLPGEERLPWHGWDPGPRGAPRPRELSRESRAAGRPPGIPEDPGTLLPPGGSGRLPAVASSVDAEPV